ncbi:MAG: adenosylcobinamide-GDP ribazoletransferase [Eubacteriales bacterium]|nr:adenosylcobinamide-GDP ribazoletransferase [Eubacteriales bacterium]
MKSFLLMLSLFTRIPVKAKPEADGARFHMGIKYVFVIALLIGVPVSLVMLLGQWVGPAIAAFAAFLLYLLITGGLHVDGLADTMDAMGSNRDRQRMLDILHDSHIGTFGVLSVCVYAIGMVLLLAHADYVAAGLFPLVGRTAALLIARMSGYAREDGMGRRFVEGVGTGHVIVSVTAYIIIAGLFCVDFSAMAFDIGYAAALFIPFLVSLGTIALVAAGMSKKLGGITGDIIGFSIESAQLMYLFLFCVIIMVWQTA